jgi:hypothetical protein
MFSPDGSAVYAYSTTKNLYVYEKKSGKLMGIILVPNDRQEISGIQVSKNESLIIYTTTNLFKLEAEQQ